MNVAVLTSVSICDPKGLFKKSHVESINKLSKCIESIMQSKSSLDQYHNVAIYLIDDYSNLPWREAIIKTFGDSVIVLDNNRIKGQGGCLNFAMTNIEADIFCITDSDCIVSANWLSKCIENSVKFKELILTGPNWNHLQGRTAISKYATRNESKLMKLIFSEFISESNITSRIDCRNLVVKSNLKTEHSAFNFVEIYPGVSSHSSRMLERLKIPVRFVPDQIVEHQSIDSIHNHIKKYYQRGKFSLFREFYTNNFTSLHQAFIQKYLYRHFVWPIQNRVSPIFIFLVHGAFWMGIVLSKRTRTSRA
ncbi:MAG: glycosyltransferase family 2 protein [Flavobacteriales bacterium]|nr:glycosyltransferase family 2 protein [Flavobacteriales bacterium]